MASVSASGLVWVMESELASAMESVWAMESELASAWGSVLGSAWVWATDSGRA